MPGRARLSAPSQPGGRARVDWPVLDCAPEPMSAPAWLSGFTICLKDGVTNGNKCVSFMANMWESSCRWLGDSAGGDCLGTVGGVVNARECVWDHGDE